MLACNQRIVCPGSDSPFANLSSEANDPALFLSVRYCWGFGMHYPRICWSEISQPEAFQCAGSLCTIPQAGFPFSTGLGDPPLNTIDPPSGGGGPLGEDAVGPPDAPPDLRPLCVEDPPGSGNFICPPDPVIFWNEEQVCTVCIPDGPCYTYVCAANTFYAIGP